MKAIKKSLIHNLKYKGRVVCSVLGRSFGALLISLSLAGCGGDSGGGGTPGAGSGAAKSPAASASPTPAASVVKGRDGWPENQDLYALFDKAYEAAKTDDNKKDVDSVAKLAQSDLTGNGPFGDKALKFYTAAATKLESLAGNGGINVLGRFVRALNTPSSDTPYSKSTETFKMSEFIIKLVEAAASAEDVVQIHRSLAPCVLLEAEEKNIASGAKCDTKLILRWLDIAVYNKNFNGLDKGGPLGLLYYFNVANDLATRLTQVSDVEYAKLINSYELSASKNNLTGKEQEEALANWTAAIMRMGQGFYSSDATLKEQAEKLLTLLQNAPGPLFNKATATNEVLKAVSSLPLPTGGTPALVFDYVSTSDTAVCGITKSSRVVCSSFNTTGVQSSNVTVFELASDHTKNIHIPLGEVTALAVAKQSACAVSNSRLYCWGRNSPAIPLFENVPGSTNYLLEMPLRVGNFDDVLDVRVSDDLTCIIRKSGEVSCAGNLSDIGLTTKKTVDFYAIKNLGASDYIEASGPRFCALEKSGNVKCFTDGGGFEYYDIGATRYGLGKYLEAVQIEGLSAADDSGISDLSVGRNHVCGTLSNGAVRCRGKSEQDNSPEGYYSFKLGFLEQHQPRDVLPSTTRPLNIASTETKNCAVIKESSQNTTGVVKCWGTGMNEWKSSYVYTYPDGRGSFAAGRDSSGDAVPLYPSMPQASMVSVSPRKVCALTGAGKIECIGGVSQSGHEEFTSPTKVLE